MSGVVTVFVPLLLVHHSSSVDMARKVYSDGMTPKDRKRTWM
jgi:uncharacterized protein (DUF305 family)